MRHTMVEEFQLDRYLAEELSSLPALSDEGHRVDVILNRFKNGIVTRSEVRAELLEVLETLGIPNLPLNHMHAVLHGDYTVIQVPEESPYVYTAGISLVDDYELIMCGSFTVGMLTHLIRDVRSMVNTCPTLPTEFHSETYTRGGNPIWYKLVECTDVTRITTELASLLNMETYLPEPPVRMYQIHAYENKDYTNPLTQELFKE